MDYKKIHKLSLILAVLYLILSLLSIILTAHYWILDDWVMGKWLPVPSQFKEKDKFPIDDVIVDFTEPCTNATIVSGCLGLWAAALAIVSHFKVRSAEMDNDYSLVRPCLLGK